MRMSNEIAEALEHHAANLEALGIKDCDEDHPSMRYYRTATEAARIVRAFGMLEAAHHTPGIDCEACKQWKAVLAERDALAAKLKACETERDAWHNAADEASRP